MNLAGNAVKDAGSLALLADLERLDLSGNAVVDLSPLGALPNLKYLGVAGNRVADVTAFADLYALVRLDLGGNVVVDAAPLGDAGQLVWLRLSGNRLATLDGLGRLRELSGCGWRTTRCLTAPPWRGPSAPGWMWRPMGGRRGTPDIGALGRDARRRPSQGPANPQQRDGTSPSPTGPDRTPGRADANASAGRAVAPRWGTAYKRPFDLAALYVVGVLLAPLWLLIAVAVALAVKLGDGGPVLYRQRRLGLGGRVFELVKFRTMPVDSEDATGPVWAAQPDRRAAPVGRLLRRLRLDELPQALNVLRGEMSLVGPRPERPELAPRCERAAPGFARRLAVRPGLAGLAQARRGAAATPRQKLRYDLLYIEAMGPWLDIRLCAACLLRVLAEAVSSRRRIRRGHPPRTGAPARPPVRRQDGPHYLRYRDASATVAGMRRQMGHQAPDGTPTRPGGVGVPTGCGPERVSPSELS